MRAFKTVILAAVSVLALPATVGMSLVPSAAMAQQVPTIRVGQTLTGAFVGGEPMFDDQYPLRGYELTLRRGETVTITLASRDIGVLPLVIGPNNFTALPEDATPQSVTITAPAAGTYTIAVLATSVNTGSFTVSVRSGGQAAAPSPPPPPPPAARPSPPPPPPPTARLSPPPSARPAPRSNTAPSRGQATTTMTISGAWTEADSRLDRGEPFDQYPLQLRRGDQVAIRMEAGSVVQLLVATGPNDFAEAAEIGTQSTLQFTAQSAGEYFVGVAPTRPNTTGTYRLVITITGQ